MFFMAYDETRLVESLTGYVSQFKEDKSWTKLGQHREDGIHKFAHHVGWMAPEIAKTAIVAKLADDLLTRREKWAAADEVHAVSWYDSVYGQAAEITERGMAGRTIGNPLLQYAAEVEMEFWHDLVRSFPVETKARYWAARWTAEQAERAAEQAKRDAEAAARAAEAEAEKEARRAARAEKRAARKAAQ